MTTFRRLRGLLVPYQKRILLALGCTALACLLGLPIPVLTQHIVDEALQAGGALIPVYLVLLLGIYLAQACITLAGALVIGRVGLRVVRDLRHELYVRLQRVGLAFYDQTPAGAIISRVTDDVAAVQNLITNQTLAILTDLGTTAVILLWLGWRHPLLLIVVLSVLPWYVLTFRRFTRRIRAGTVQVRTQLDGIFGRLKEKLDGMIVIKACAREEREMTEFAAQINAAHGSRVRVGRLGAAFSTLTVALGGIGTALVFAVAAAQVAAGQMTPGEAVAATAFVALVFGPIARLADLATIFEQAGASLDRLGEILDRKPDAMETQPSLPLDRVRGRIEFDQVSFGYRRNQPVIWDIRLRIEPGMKVALVGPTGCGKSTLVNLLLRFYEPNLGEIRIDGVPIRNVSVTDLRRQIGVVPQDPVIFRHSLADNIRYGMPGASDAQVEAAARAALVHDFACRLPQGYDTLIGEGCCKLSQGERQRIAIARAFCKNPAIVVLDEPTSSLDSENETLIHTALTGLLQGRTSIIIAHRLATIRDANRIVVMDGGEIVQMGVHAELRADAGGMYHRLCQRQFGYGPPKPAPESDDVVVAARRATLVEALGSSRATKPTERAEVAVG